MSDHDPSRQPLDDLVAMLDDPRFTALHRRELSLRNSSAHVNPVMLAAAGRDSVYVDEWRCHALHCASCTRLFEYFGLV